MVSIRIFHVSLWNLGGRESFGVSSGECKIGVSLTVCTEQNLELIGVEFK